MPISFAPQTIEALAQVISGGSGNSNAPSIGIYRSGPKLESFMRGCNVRMSIGSGSRLPTLITALEGANDCGDEAVLSRIAERAADSRDFLNEPSRLTAVIEYLNARLRYDGLELQRRGRDVRLVPLSATPAVVGSLVDLAVTINFDTVTRDLERALASAESDPEDAVTSACSIIESVCRSILIELGEPLPERRDIQNLYRAVRTPLGLSPAEAGSSVRDEIAGDVRAILGGLNAAVQGVGALRTHGGDAHGRERGYVRSIDARIARLAIHSASAVSLFLIETWQRKHPARNLPAR